MSNGFRQQPQPSTKDKFRSVDVELKNLQMSARITQMMCQRLMENTKGIGSDVAKLFQLVSELQYKFLAVQKASGLDVAQLNKIAEELRLKDFVEASDKQDAEEGFTVADTVEDDSTVILTSSTGTEPDQGIFRSRIKLAEAGVPELVEGLKGQTVGTKVKAKLNGVEHEVELLGIRRPKREPKLEAVPAEAAPAAQ